MSRDFTKGGRGHKAPYETTHIRVPRPVVEDCRKICQAYRDSLDPNTGQQTAEGKNRLIQLLSSIIAKLKGE